MRCLGEEVVGRDSYQGLSFAFLREGGSEGIRRRARHPRKCRIGACCARRLEEEGLKDEATSQFIIIMIIDYDHYVSGAEG